MSLTNRGHIHINQNRTLIGLDFYFSQGGRRRDFLLILFQTVKYTTKKLPCG